MADPSLLSYHKMAAEGGAGGKVTDVEDELKRFKALFALPEFDYCDLGIMDSFTLKNYPYSPEGVAMFLNDNDLNKTNLKDIVYACIIVKLISLGLIFGDAGTDNVDQDLGLVSQKELERFAPLAESMYVVALHAFHRGSWREANSNWHDCYTAVTGDQFLNARRFEKVRRLIISSSAGTIGKICELVTVGSLRSEHEVLQRRLTWLSSPSLVRTATKEMANYDQVLGCFDADALISYRKFDQAGLVAQIASGPLGKYCKGHIDPLAGNDVPDDTKIAELKRIEPPCDAKTLKKAYIILEEIDFPFGQWYQGKKAMKTMDFDDVKFRAIVKACHMKEKKKRLVI